MSTTVLYLGATGYIGALVEATGAITAKDSLKDYDALSEQVAQADIIFNNADCDDVALTESILKGLKKRFDYGKGAGTLIHTSGVGNFIDGGKEGRFDANSRVWTDAEEEIRGITPALMHGKVDVAVLKAGEEGYVNTFIIAPAAVFGRGLGPVKKTGPFMLSQYVRRGNAFYFGEGTNLCSVIHIEDLVEVFNLVFNRALRARDVPLTDSPYARYYFVEAGALTWKRIADAYAKALFERGKVSKPEAVSLTYEEGGPVAFAWACSMYVKSVQTKTLGWEPKHKITDDVIIGGIDDGLAAWKA